MSSLPRPSQNTEVYSVAFAETELLCHQLRTVFLDMKIKFAQEIFLNRAQWLNWHCYKYYRTRVYFCLYFSTPDAVKPTVNTQSFLLLLLSRRVCSFFQAILNSVPHFISIFTQRKVSDSENLYTVIILYTEQYFYSTDLTKGIKNSPMKIP